MSKAKIWDAPLPHYYAKKQSGADDETAQECLEDGYNYNYKFCEICGIDLTTTACATCKPKPVKEKTQ